MAAKVKVVESEFKVPSLAEADPEFAALVERREQIVAEIAANRRERDALESDLKKTPALRAVRPELASLLGDSVETDQRPARLAELKRRAANLDEADAILTKRQRERKSAASAAVCAAIRPEFARRVGALASALKAAHVARQNFESLLDDLEAEDVEWLRLGIVRQSWMGDIHGGRVDQFLREAKEHGYDV